MRLPLEMRSVYVLAMQVDANIILLHGALGASAQLEPLAAALGARMRTFRMDFEGHGDAPAVERPFRMQHFAENVLELLDREHLDRVSIFGYSMGGYVALLLGAAHPERFTRVVTLGTKFRWDPATAEREARRLDPAAIRAKVPKFADDLARRHDSAGGWERVLAATADLLRDLGEHPPLTDAVLASIRQPVRVLVGDRDNTVSVDESREAASVLGNGELVVLSDTPHPIEQVDPVLIVSELTAKG